MTKSDVQEKAVAFISENKYILLEKATGTGKSKTILEACVKAASVLIVVKQVPHIENWKDEMIKWGYDVMKYTFVTYASFPKYENKAFNAIVFDEGHAITDRIVSSVKTMPAGKIIICTATMPYAKKVLIKKIANFKLFRFDLNDAIENEVLPQPIIYIYSRPLDNSDRNLIYTKTKKTATSEVTVGYGERLFYLKRKDVNVNIECTELEYYKLLTEQFEYWRSRYFEEKNPQKWLEVKYLRLGLERKKWLNSLKTDKAKELIQSMIDKRLLVFTMSIEQCDEIAAHFNSIPVHSKRENNQETINRFNNGETNLILNCNILVESMNFINLDGSIIIGLDGKPLTTYQKIGRSLRSERPEIHIIIVPNTQDEKYLNDFLKGYKHGITYK